MLNTLTTDTIIGTRKITKAELQKFFKDTLGKDYVNHADVMENILKKILIYGTPFIGGKRIAKVKFCAGLH